ncbi:hypothetical protein EN904_09840 [Mesorhizobium sp. M7A.F.Ca.CA.001.07.2.1]|uniref:glutathione binding-like protein n=1 Tax=Mesorhizobium TaxID=68287 RepID=UPI000FCB3630|nr:MULTISPECIES: glutathione binding-like protein [Mesorhizobium]RVB34076.1 hypothetical protein EN918_17810 [Mesorhizobium sp. M7A.F.Ca.CA.004.05.1.1]MCF6124536.1 glutathione binding-like protein [Mesorhizobium ciceri]MCQ8814376.1 glutathione binding-like protein [Mesorhizobium sp. SEMIA396]RUX74775.1 hypothetical protein EN983_19110 [Mesorhizobium sp. M7A.F.Ca.CA.004.08.2.1]RUX89817.1 hypothetical protein EN982_01140 [Mesorhizobium sp. M7A.F.Ca.CA.004.08.1.1]
MSNDKNNLLESWMLQRLKQVEAALAHREWLVDGQFSAADILMTDVLWIPMVMAAGSFPTT